MNFRSMLRPVAHVASRLALPLLERPLPGFAGEIVRIIHERRQSEIDNPNLDFWRYPNAKAERYNPAEAARILWFVRSNAQRINRTAELFADEESRHLYAQLFAFRALGPRHVSLPRSNPAYMAFFDRAREMRTEPASLVEPAIGTVEHYSVPTGEGRIEVDCWLGNVIAWGLERQYWFTRGDVRIMPEKGDVVIDGGACFGDTSLAFADAVGPSGKVHAFEPMPNNRRILDKNLASNAGLADRISVHPFALSAQTGRALTFSDSGAAARPNKRGSVEVQTKRIDDLKTDCVDFIKMDIEGGEAEAITGAANTLIKYKPKLAISIYHSLEDMVRIAPAIHAIESSYEFYLDHHTIYSEETILYAIGGERKHGRTSHSSKASAD